MTFKASTRLTAALGLLFLAGCERPAITGDKTPPDISVYVSRARGRNYFRTTDGFQKSPNDCVFVREMPTQLILVASDTGGIRMAGINTLNATIVHETSLRLTINPVRPRSTLRRPRLKAQSSLQPGPPVQNDLRSH